MRIELPDRLSADRVLLRPMRSEDAVPYVGAFADDPELGRLLGEERDPDESSVCRRIERQGQLAEHGEAAELAVADPGSDAFLGAVILHSFAWQHRRCEVGFWLVPEIRGRGLGRDAVGASIWWAFRELGLERIEMTTTRDNLEAGSLARQLGFTREGVLRARNLERGRRVDIVYYGLLRDEWGR